MWPLLKFAVGGATVHTDSSDSLSQDHSTERDKTGHFSLRFSRSNADFSSFLSFPFLFCTFYNKDNGEIWSNLNVFFFLWPAIIFYGNDKYIQ